MGNTKIEWAEKTWNPITGCTKISPGCANCYAERMSKRLAGRCGYDKDNPFQVTLHVDRLDEPLKWRKPQMVFVCSMGDLFHELVPFPQIKEIWNIMAKAQKHTFLVLTKRSKRMLEFTQWMAGADHISTAEWPRNVWLGVTAENQEKANERIPILLQIPAAKRFVSVEPMLGSVDLEDWFESSQFCNACGSVQLETDDTSCRRCGDIRTRPGKNGLDWVICGGETGPGARPMHPDWARSLRDQCVSAGVPFFFKQQGEWGYTPYGNRKGMNPYESIRLNGDLLFRCGKKFAGRNLDGREWNERPEVE